jgi:aldehyde dehydrogenase (NAD+)
LALYVFTKNNKLFARVKDETSSGACLQNQVLMHGGVEDLPFGGVGHSGIGQYHGKFSFETFSHKRAVLSSNFFGDSLSGFIYPPYSPFKTKQIQMIGEIRQNMVTRALTNVYFYLALGIGGLVYYKNYFA